MLKAVLLRAWAALAVLMLLSTGVAAATADPAEDDELNDEFEFLEEAATVESAARHSQQIGMSPSAITVITREDIETSGAGSLPDLLRLVPGMEVLITSPFFINITSRLYWTNEGQHYLVLIDGREANVELLGFPPWTLQPVFLEEIEKIEIIRGPGSSLYGANALAGVISITTRQIPEKTSAWASTGGGDYAHLSAAAGAATRIGPFGFSLSGGYERAGSFNDFHDEALRVWKLRLHGKYDLDRKRRLILDSGFSRGNGPFGTSMGVLDTNFHTRQVRLAYESEDLNGQIYWMQDPNDSSFDSPLVYHGIRLARFAPFHIDAHTLDAQLQWSLPRFWDPLLVIAGAGGRLSWLSCAKALSPDYADPNSSGYHKPGEDHNEGRLGVFLHAELSPAEWVTITAGLRFDYNSVTDPFISPRLAAVFSPGQGQYIRLGAARAFRKPSYLETGAHVMAEFPADSPIQGADQDKFQEFLTRVIGNGDLDNEVLTSFEAGYLGQFLDGRLNVSLDLYINLLRDLVGIDLDVVPGAQGLPDLDKTYFHFANNAPAMDVYGGELAMRYSPSRRLSFLAAWAHREIFDRESGRVVDSSPKNLFVLGGRFKTESGLLGSLYGYFRSELRDRSVQNPAGLLEGLITQHLGQEILLIGRLGYRFSAGDARLEVGSKLFLPISPSSSRLFRVRELGGGVTPEGKAYGGELLGRVVIAYLAMSL